MRETRDGIMNLKVLRKSRKAPVCGDIFVLMVNKHKFMFGRVIRADFEFAGWPNCFLIYIYSTTSDSIKVIPYLDKNKLLVPPQVVNRQPWLKGYFMTIANGPLEKDDVLPRHCFVDFRGWYFDENGKRLRKRIEPCGVYGLGSYGSVNLHVSEALGLPV